MIHIDRRLEVLLWLAGFAAIVLAGSYWLTPADTSAGDKRHVRIGYVSWAEGIAMTHLAKVVLEQEMDYTVSLTMADPAPIFTSLAKGDFDFFLDAWLPLTHKPYMEKYGDTLVDLGYNYKDARIGLVVPAYVEVSSIPQLADQAGKFDNDITGIDSGAGIMKATRKAIQAYGLDLTLLTSSGAAMTASLKDAIAAEQPIVVTGWKPHWMFARWRLRFLEDPKTVYGKAENIHTIARPAIARDLPEAADFFERFFFTDQQIGSLMDEVNQAGDPETAARSWMKENRELVESWLPGGS
ncbi:MAG: glycine betaine ABC transporter substrate-binding protein [Desulfovibrionaceae bacterium]